MKKLLLLFLVLILIPIGCEKRDKTKLDTSKLKKIEQPNLAKLTKDQRKMIPITYESTSLEEGLRALPFKMKIPSKLPFKVEPINSFSIYDVDHNGKKLNVSYSLTHFGKSQKFFVMYITVYNYKSELDFDLEYNEPEDIIQLKDGVTGTFTGITSLGISYKLDEPNLDETNFDQIKQAENLKENTLIFEKDGIYYHLTYVANIGTSEKVKQYVKNIANQML